MKVSVISMSVLLTAFFGIVPAFSQAQDANDVQQMKQKEEAMKEQESKKTADANAISDPNAVKARIEQFKGLDQELKKINEESRNEIREWTRGRLDDRLVLALAMQKQIKAEFEFLRTLAVKENALETAAAIDGMLLDRQERFKDVIEELEKNSERHRRLLEREERRNQERSRERMLRERREPRERPSRRDVQQ